jgi:hypothetical protein
MMVKYRKPTASKPHNDGSEMRETFHTTISSNFAQDFNHERLEINETHEREPGITRTIHGFTLHSFRTGTSEV